MRSPLPYMNREGAHAVVDHSSTLPLLLTKKKIFPEQGVVLPVFRGAEVIMLDLNCPYFLFLIKPEKHNQTFDVKGSGWGRRPNISTEEGRKFRRKKVGSRAVVPKFLTEEGRLGQASAWKF